MTDYRHVLQQLPQPLLLIGRSFQVTLASQGARELFGAAAEGRHFATLLRQPEFFAAVEAALGGQASQEMPLEWRQATGDRFFQARVTPVGDEVLVTLTETTQQVVSEVMRRDFVANVSHELRTPLTALSGFIETLQGPAREDSATRERFLGIMQAEVGRMVRLVRDLLELSRVEAEERRPPTERQDLAELARSVALALRPLADAAGVTLVVEEDGQPLMIHADRDQMVQVLTNLFENAVKYGSPPGGQVQVTLGRSDLPLGPMARVVVADQGEGIAAHHLPRLTERFYRVDNHRSREKGGTGLGLAIAKHIVTRHRGRLRIESEPGKGSRFTVLVPLLQG